VEEVITHGENGLLVDFFDIDQFSKTAIDVLSRPSEYGKPREAARRTIVERYDLYGVCLPQWLDFVRRVTVSDKGSDLTSLQSHRDQGQTSADTTS
jgi:hypothetical protein